MNVYGSDALLYGFRGALETALCKTAPKHQRFIVAPTWRVGEPIPGDKADIWALWRKQGRKGIKDLIATYGATLEENKQAVDKLGLVKREKRGWDPPPVTERQLGRHKQRFGRECTDGIKTVDEASAPHERPLPPDWRQRRLRCIRRDKNTCQRCGREISTRLLTAHHVIPRIDGGPDSLENLVTLCNVSRRENGGLGCHDWVEIRAKRLTSAAAIRGSWPTSSK